MDIVGGIVDPAAGMDFPKNGTVEHRKDINLSCQRIVHQEGILLCGIGAPYGNIVYPVCNGVQLPQHVSGLTAIEAQGDGVAGLDQVQRLIDANKFGFIESLLLIIHVVYS